MTASQHSRPSLGVIILTREEEENLPIALESLRPLRPMVFIVDSGSSDRTVELAREWGCECAARPWTNYADQFKWAMEHCPFSADWFMRMDADERLTAELARELPEAIAAAGEGTDGFRMRRRVYFWGKWIRHGGYYPTWLTRVWRAGHASIESRWMDEHMVVHGGGVAALQGDIIDENHKGLTFWTDKHNRYADREVRDLLAMASAEAPAAQLEGQAGRRRWVKQNLYARSPLLLRAVAYWFLRYIVLLGFLDGRPGFVFHFLQGFWYRFLVDAKLLEARRNQQGSGSGEG
ncbi:MAG: glycosyltransferase family 2 protein [Anaeromyxobacteraceae bacterium]